jgi:hypothetical protein
MAGEGTAHLMADRKQRERIPVLDGFLFFPPLLHLGLQPVEQFHPHSEGSSPLSESSLEMPLKIHLEVCFTNQIDSQD